jgi:hypothetical protein
MNGSGGIKWRSPYVPSSSNVHLTEKVNVKLSLWLFKYHAKKACGGGEV